MKVFIKFCAVMSILSAILLVSRFMSAETNMHRYARIANEGVIYASRLDVENKVYRIAGVETVLSNDETGKRMHMWTNMVTHIENHWVDGFSGFHWFKPKIDELIAAGVPVSTTRIFAYSYQLGQINISSGALDDLRFCEKQGWKDINMLMIVAKHGCFDCVAYMVEDLKADVNHVSCGGYTAAMFAGERGHYKVARYLVDRMDLVVRNTQTFHAFNGRSLFDVLPLYDYEDKVDALTSTARFRYFLWGKGIRSGVELNNEARCFPRGVDIDHPVRKLLSTVHLYDQKNIYSEKASDIGYCMFMLRQYEYRCNKFQFECNKQKQMFTYIESRGYAMSNWKNDRTYYKALVPNSDTVGDFYLNGGASFRYAMENLNGKKCNSVFSNCSKKLKRKRRSF